MCLQWNNNSFFVSFTFSVHLSQENIRNQYQSNEISHPIFGNGKPGIPETVTTTKRRKGQESETVSTKQITSEQVEFISVQGYRYLLLLSFRNWFCLYAILTTTQTFTCSNSTIETFGKDANDVVWGVFIVTLPLNIFLIFF